MIYSICTIRPRGFVGYLESNEAAQAAIAILEQSFAGVRFGYFAGPDFNHPACETAIRRRLLSPEVQDEIRRRTGSGPA